MFTSRLITFIFIIFSLFLSVLLQLSELFVSFEEKPQGAASLAQVHKAVLYDGRIVAVKVQHPKVQRQSSKDIMVIEVSMSFENFLVFASYNSRAIYPQSVSAPSCLGFNTNGWSHKESHVHINTGPKGKIPMQCTHTYRQLVTNETYMHVFGLWEDDGEPNYAWCEDANFRHKITEFTVQYDTRCDSSTGSFPEPRVDFSNLFVFNRKQGQIRLSQSKSFQRLR